MKAAVYEQVVSLSCRSQKCRKTNKYNRSLASYWFIPYYVLFTYVANGLSSALFGVLRVCSGTLLS